MSLDPADELYEAIRADPDDVLEISRRTGFQRASIERVKDHLFVAIHWLDLYEALGVPGEWRRFDSDQKIAEAWERLRNGRFGPDDLQLLRHETAEAWFNRKHGPGYRLAHRAAQRRFPWTSTA